MDSIKTYNILQTVYVQDGNKVHQIVLRERNTDDTFQKTTQEEQAKKNISKNKNKGFFNQLFSAAAAPVKKVLGYGKKEVKAPLKSEIKPVNEDEKKYDILITTFDRELPPERNLNFEVNSMDNYDIQINLPEENEAEIERDDTKGNTETVQEKTPWKMPPKNLTEKDKENVKIIKQKINEGEEAYKKTVINNGGENIISQTDDKITLINENESIGVELRRNEEDDVFLDIAYLDKNNRGAVVTLDSNCHFVNASNIIGGLNGDIYKAIKTALELNKQNSETNFDYEAAEKIIKNRKQ